MEKKSPLERARDYLKGLMVSEERAEVVFKIVSDGSDLPSKSWSRF